MQTIIIAKNHKFTTLFLSLAFCAFFITARTAIITDTGVSNLYVHQAEAFLQGNLDIPEKHPDVAIYKNRYYVPFPPFPAVLLLPFKAVFETVNTTIIALALTLINVFTAKDILKKLSLGGSLSYWLLVAFFMGTGYWLVVIESDGVWFFAHVVCVTFIFLSIREALGNGRGLMVGFFLGFAFLSRQLSIYISIFIIAALLANQNNNTKNSKVRAISGFITALSTCVSFYLAFNYLRFENPFDTGYSYLDLPSFLKSRVEQFGLFSPAYIPFNVIYMFFQGPHFDFRGELIPQAMDWFGTSITFASPFLFSAFFAKGNKLIKYSAWLAISCSITHMMFYYNNGWAQVNTQRYTLDFLPLFLVLIALAIESIKNSRLFYISIIYSVSLNIIFLLYPYVEGMLSDLFLK